MIRSVGGRAFRRRLSLVAGDFVVSAVPFMLYDVTKNAGRRWCAQTICGKGDRVRRCRRRHGGRAAS